MPSEPNDSMLRKLWHASLSVLASTLILWFSVQILLKIWKVLLIVAVVGLGIWLLARWWYLRN